MYTVLVAMLPILIVALVVTVACITIVVVAVIVLVTVLVVLAIARRPLFTALGMVLLLAVRSIAIFFFATAIVAFLTRGIVLLIGR